MKKLLTTFGLLFTIATATYAQTPPDAFSYSAVARDANSNPIATTTIGIQISLRQGSPLGTVVYQENHFVNTDQFGLFNLTVGGGSVQSGNISTIDWAAANYYLQVGMDANGGTNFLNMGTTQLLSVPYALYAKSAGTVSGGGTGFSGDYNDLTNTPTIPIVPTNVSAFTNDAGYVTTLNDDDPTNELQQLSVSATGDTLKLQNGGFVIIPGISAANNQGGGGNGIFTPGNGVTFNGYTYTSIVLGNGQEWMAENLRTTQYSDGTAITLVTDPTQWAANNNNGTTVPMMSWYNNDQATYTANTFGALYNWYAVSPTTNGNRNVCPVGWHVPTNAEWTILTDYLGGNSVAGGKMKSTGTQYWQSPNTAATNESGFSGLPGGLRDGYGTFGHIGGNGYWWSSTELNTYDAWLGNLHYLNGIAYGGDNPKTVGFSVRCLRD